MTTAPSPAKARNRGEWKKHLFVWAVLLLELFPFYMMVQISFKDSATFIQNPWLPSFADIEWTNWAFAFKLITPYITNTVFVAVTTVICSLTFAILASYFFARYKMPAGNLLWSAFLFIMLMPSVANIVPLFSMLKSMNLLNTLWALILVGVAGGQVFNLFVLRNFIEDIPKDLFEAAEMDGASHLNQIWNVVIPMSAPILGTLGILSFLGSWNDFFLPLLVLRDPDLYTIGVGLIYLDGEYVKQWGKIMAAFFVASLPLIILFSLSMKLFVRGLSSGAVKG